MIKTFFAFLGLAVLNKVVRDSLPDMSIKSLWKRFKVFLGFTVTTGMVCVALVRVKYGKQTGKEQQLMLAYAIIIIIGVMAVIYLRRKNAEQNRALLNGE